MSLEFFRSNRQSSDRPTQRVSQLKEREISRLQCMSVAEPAAEPHQMTGRPAPHSHFNIGFNQDRKKVTAR